MLIVNFSESSPCSFSAGSTSQLREMAQPVKNCTDPPGRPVDAKHDAMCPEEGKERDGEELD